MPWLIVLLGYILGSIPTTYIAGDIRQMGDGNVGAANAFRQLGAKIGVTVGIIDASKGMLAIFIARAVGLPQLVILFTGVATVAGHNWPVFLSFRGGRGESTTIGIMLSLATLPMLIAAVPAVIVLILKKNVPLASVFLFIPLILVSWWLQVPGELIAYILVLACLLGVTHYLRTRHISEVKNT